MKEILIIFLTIVPLLLIFILYSYIRIYTNLKKIIKKHNNDEEMQIISDLLDKIYDKLPITIDEEDNDKNKIIHEVHNK